MKIPSLCDKNFTGQIRSPFNKIIIFGYYDGATSGVAQCGNCSIAYRFEIVAWDSNQENRIYSLAAIDSETFNSIVRIMSKLGTPQWPCWIPRWEFGSDEEEKHTRYSLDLLLQRASRANLVIATDHIEKEILLCREIEADAFDQLTNTVYPDPRVSKYWQHYLGLEIR